jgi:hypothetical protein
MAPRKRKQNADEKALPEVTAAERAAVEKYRAKKKPEPNAAKPYDNMTAQERTAIDRFLARNAANPAPRLKVLNGEQAVSISPDHPDNGTGQMLLMDAFGTADFDFFNGLLDQLANAGSKGGQIDERRLNFMFSVVKGIQPRDQLEAMLAAQMAAVHMATMTFAPRRGHTAAGQRRARIQQALPDIRNPHGDAQALPDGRRAEGHGAACFRSRRRPGDRRQRHTGAT